MYDLSLIHILGVTNVIPFFGPYIGAIPSAVLILLTDPRMGIYFIIFIIALQQFDGNVLGPKILGDTTGLSAFWVVFSILIAGGLFGIPGMILGAVSYTHLVDAKADWLYELPQWEKIFDEETRKRLYREQKSSVTIRKPKKIGRNDPCPCGSGKKYKKCCGRNA